MGAFFVRRPIVAIVIAILTTMAGYVAMTKLPTAQYPDIVPPQIQVTTTYTGADALTIEQSVATPLEQQMNGVDYMIYMQSTNANDGTMTLKVTFDVETDINLDQVNTQNRVSQAQPNLPPDVNQFGMTVKKATSNPLLVVSLYSPKGTYDALFLGNYATINVNDAIYRVPGVGQIQNYGTADYAMRIWVKPDRLASLGLTVPDIITAVQQQSTVNPSGGIGTEPAPKGQEFTYTVRSQGRLVSAEEFGDVVVRLNPDGSVVRLKDVSRIDLGALNYQQRSRLNGKPACPIGIFQVPGSNAIAVADGVKKTMEELKRRFPDDLDYVVALDTTLPVTEGIKEIEHTLFEAIGLVIIVVFLFLQGWRATLIPLLAVPVSLIGTFIFFPMLGFSINTLSLFGLVLAIGLVVDDAIVVVEAVEHHIEHGLSPKDATLKAMEEVTQPVIGIALVLSAVFIPVAFMGGIQGRMNMQFAITIAVSVLISAFNALSLSPALCSLLLRPKKEARGLLGKFFAWFNRVFGRMTDGYVGLSRHLVRKVVLSVGILAGFIVLCGLLGKKLPAGFLPNEDQGYFFINVQLPDASSLQRTDAVCKRIEEILGKTPIVAALLAITACEKKAPPEAPPPAVQVAPVVQKDVTIYEDWIGSLDGYVNAEIRPQIEGYVLRQTYREGFAVKAGETLFEIDPRQLQVTYDQTKGTLAQYEATLANAKTTVARYRPLAAEKAISQQELDDAETREHTAQANVESARASLEKAKLDLAWTKVLSPIDGVAGVAKSQVGDLVNRQVVMTTVSQVNPIKVYFNPSEQEYLAWVAKYGSPEKTIKADQKLEKGPLELILSDGSVFPHRGKPFLVGREVDVKTGTIQLAGVFPNPDNLLRPGQYGKVRVARRRPEGGDPRAAARRQRAAGQLPGRRRRRRQHGDDQGRHPGPARRQHVGRREGTQPGRPHHRRGHPAGAERDEGGAQGSRGRRPTPPRRTPRRLRPKRRRKVGPLWARSSSAGRSSRSSSRSSP